MASSSEVTRKSQWSLFQRFCADHSLSSLPCTEHTVGLFIAFLSQRHLEYNTIVNYVHSITPLHHRHDLAGPNLQHFSIREALAGLQRSRRELPFQKRAITLDHLHHIHDNLCSLPQERRAVFWAACLTAFNSLLRSANLFPQPTQPDKAIKNRDVLHTDRGLELTTRVLKTSRFVGEEMKIPLHRLPASNYLCPVRALERLMAHELPVQLQERPGGTSPLRAKVRCRSSVPSSFGKGMRFFLHTFLPQRRHNVRDQQWC